MNAEGATTMLSGMAVLRGLGRGRGATGETRAKNIRHPSRALTASG